MEKYYCLITKSRWPSFCRRVSLFHITFIFIPIYIHFILLIQLFLPFAFLYSLMISYRLHFHLLLKNISFHLLFSWHHTLPNAALLHYSFIYQMSYTITFFRDIQCTYCVHHYHYKHTAKSTENSLLIWHYILSDLWNLKFHYIVKVPPEDGMMAV
jgi:hypothetical protein